MSDRLFDNEQAANVVSFPGTLAAETAPGLPRHDIAAMLREIAERAERGEIDALVLAFSLSEGGVGTGISSPENDYYGMLGACEELKDNIKQRRDDLAERGGAG